MIAESQLDTWAALGPTTQFTDTYNRIRDNLLDKGAPYPLADTEVFLQGSYKNTTNVYGDSDVDIVLCHNGAFYKDLSRLSAADRRLQRRSRRQRARMATTTSSATRPRTSRGYTTTCR